MAIQSVYIINKSGGLIYQRDFAQRQQRLDANDHLRLGSTFHACHLIASQFGPSTNVTGIQALETNTFRLQCLQTLTGMKIFVTADPTDAQLDDVLNNIYETYTDYVLKNPFYELEMPIMGTTNRCDKFEAAVAELINRRDH
eukprot:m51a1_g8121 hypothetical protein (142) ;mRNA; r:180987-181633